MNVEQRAEFQASSVRIGDSSLDAFNAGSISFSTSGDFFLSENSDLLIAGQNVANSANLRSQGNLTNAAQAEVQISQTTILFGERVELGFQSGDVINFGSLTVNSPGSVFVFEDSSTLMTGASNAQTLVLGSSDIQDGTLASISVAGITTLKAPSIQLGDTATDQFSSLGLTIESSGDVEVSADSSIILAGSVMAQNLTLTANGNLTDAEDAVIEIADTLQMRADRIHLGDEIMGFFSASNLNFQSPGNVNLTSQSTINLVGNNSAQNLELTSTADILDDDQAETVVSNSVFLNGVDIVLGNSDFDCFDVDTALLFVTAAGVENVTIGC